LNANASKSNFSISKFKGLTSYGKNTKFWKDNDNRMTERKKKNGTTKWFKDLKRKK
jgi:hypothetical protein